jgi:glycosyltransferase involved in cell wall biosynthesis
MLGTFGFRPKATMSARALGMAQALIEHGWHATIATVPWDYPADAGRRWGDGEVDIINTRAVRPVAWPLAVAELRGVAREVQPHVIHLFKPKGYGDLAARSLSRLPVVVDMDDWEGDRGWNDLLPYGRLQRRLFNWQERTWPARAGAVTAASRTLVQRAVELGAAPERVVYVPNGLPAARFTELRSEPADLPELIAQLAEQQGPRVLVYTRFVEFGPEPLVHLLVSLTKGFPHARLVIAGRSADGNAEQTLERVARQAGVADRVSRLGWIDPAHLGAIARRCHVAVFPFEDTLVNRAKCSVKVLELLATGLPVVATAVGENRSYIRHGVTGFLVKPRDADTLAGAVQEAINDSGHPGVVAQRSAREASSRYSWEILVTRTLEAYQRAAGSRKTS